MESETSTMAHYPFHKVKPIVLASDPMPAFYFPYKKNFLGESSNDSSYKWITEEKTVSSAPPVGQIQIDQNEPLNFRTNYNDEYINHGIRICEYKAYKIAKKINENK